MLKDSFESFVKQLQLDNKQDMIGRYKRILKKLNESFCGIDSNEENGYIVGSLGRETAVKGFSDMDMLFVLPPERKADYEKKKGNSQSILLQDIKKVIKTIHPRTIVKGDGQVVVVRMESAKCEIEVCPVFKRSDGGFDYPDANNGGRWKKTDPLPELVASEVTTNETNGHFLYICQMFRAWKNHKGFKIGGLLIDTLVYNFLNDNRFSKYKKTSFDNYLSLWIDLFSYLKELNQDQSYWYALGSGQHVYNKTGAFVRKAKKVYEEIKDLNEDSEELYTSLQNIFGKKFPVPSSISESFSIKKSRFFNGTRDTEEFVEDKFDVDIRYRLKIDCDVEMNGFRKDSLREILNRKVRLKRYKQLTFKIIENEFADLLKGLQDPEDLYSYGKYKIYWKVLNRGEEAVKNRQIRGQIFKGGKFQIEHTKFHGEHIVECYIVHNNVVIAKDRITVPIE